MWARSTCRTDSRRSVSFDTSTKPETPVSWGASEIGVRSDPQRVGLEREAEAVAAAQDLTPAAGRARRRVGGLHGAHVSEVRRQDSYTSAGEFEKLRPAIGVVLEVPNPGGCFADGAAGR